MIYKKLFFVFTLFIVCLNTYCQTEKIKAKGEYAAIDGQDDITHLLKSENTETVNQTIDSILVNPNRYNPIVMYTLSSVLFEKKRKDEAAFWYYVAQLRARYDTNLCLDESAKQLAGYMGMMFGQEINPYAFEDLKKLETTVNKVVAFVKDNEEAYDHRWINLHGMEAMKKSLDEKTEDIEMTKPKSEWTAIKQETITDYYNGFKEALVELKKRK